VSALPPDASADDSFRSVMAALGANVAIATAKGIAAVLTGSSALFAETLHTVADAGNEILLWIAIRRSRRPPDDTHPFGYGPERYYWALLAAIGMFVIGGALSIADGIRALLDPPELEAFWVGVGVLLVAIALDSLSRTVALRTLRRDALRRGISVRTLLRESPDPTVTTVYLEDSVDLLGAVLALAALVLHRLTGSAVPDAIATLMIGGLLVYIAVRLSSRNRQLLANQAVPERYVDQLRTRIVDQPGIASAANIEAVYLGPGQVLVAADVRMEPHLDGPALADALITARRTICTDVPVVARLYLTPV
jgi:cation diffusion facilitator family transporter